MPSIIGSATLIVRDRNRLAHAAPELARVDLEPDQEHVEDQAEVRRHPEGRQDVGGEECGLETSVRSRPGSSDRA